MEKPAEQKQHKFHIRTDLDLSPRSVTCWLREHRQASLLFKTCFFISKMEPSPYNFRVFKALRNIKCLECSLAHSRCSVQVSPAP